MSAAVTVSRSAFKERIRQFFATGFAPVPVSGIEWFFLRLLFGALVFTNFLDWHPYDYPSQEHPTGLARLLDLTWIHSPDLIDLPFIEGRHGMHETFVVLAAVLCLAYIIGRGLIVTLPLLALLHIIPRTLSNSQGFTHHGFQLVSLALVVQAIVVWWLAIRTWQKKPPLPAGLTLPSYMLYYSSGVVALSYVVSALTKLTNTKGLWVWRSNYICIELIKSHRLEYYKDLDPAKAGDPAAAVWLLNHPWLTRIAFGSGFFLELFAFLALKSRPWALAVGLCMIAFHRSVWWLMRLEFPMHEYLMLIFLVNVPFWIWKVRQSS